MEPRNRTSDPAAKTLPRRHPFTSIFLVLFLLDALLGLWIGTSFILGGSEFDSQRFNNVLMPFSLALLMGALVQVSLSFSQRMRWAARIIGLYVVSYWMAELALIVMIGMFIAVTRGPDAISEDQPLLSNTVTGGITLAVSGLQALVGIWAARDLASGHYLEPS